MPGLSCRITPDPWPRWPRDPATGRRPSRRRSLSRARPAGPPPVNREAVRLPSSVAALRGGARRCCRAEIPQRLATVAGSHRPGVPIRPAPTFCLDRRWAEPPAGEPLAAVFRLAPGPGVDERHPPVFDRRIVRSPTAMRPAVPPSPAPFRRAKRPSWRRWPRTLAARCRSTPHTIPTCLKNACWAAMRRTLRVMPEMGHS